jgi:VWFA-related protein
MVARILLSSALVLSMLLTAFPQQPTPPPLNQTPQLKKPYEIDSQDVVKISTNLVQIDVAVTKDGKIVPDLQPEDFEIFEDGKPQVITNFSYVSNVPEAATPTTVPAAGSREKIATPVPPAKINLGDQRRIAALVIDDQAISWENMGPVRQQIKKMIDEMSPNDLLAIIRTDGDVGALQQFTNDKRILQSALDGLRWNPCSRAGTRVFAPLGQIGPDKSICQQGYGHANTTLISLNFILKGMSLLPGRKSLVFFSDYMPIEDQERSLDGKIISTMPSSPAEMNSLPESATGSLPGLDNSYADQLQRIAEVAIRSSVVIYAVDTRGLQYTGLTPADRTTNVPAILQLEKDREHQLARGREGSDLIARQTGGFLIKNSNDFGLKRIMEDQQGYYLIGFRPAEETFNRNFHHIRARVKRSGFTVRTRAGFYGFTSEQARPPLLSTPDAMNKALGSPFGAHDVSTRLTTFFIDEGTGPLLRSFLYLDPHDLTFSDRPDGLRGANIELKAMLFGDNGKVIQEANQRGSIGIDPKTYDRTLSEGVTYTFDVPLKTPGGIQFRVAVRDVATGHIGSAGQFVDIPKLQNGLLAMSGIVIREENATGAAITNRFADDVRTGPAVRRFHQGSTADFGYMIYNASQTSKLMAQMRLYHDGKIILSPEPAAISLGGQTDRRRLTNRSRLQLGSEMTPGGYVLQIIVTDSADKQKPRVTSQWIDFEIVK